MSNNYERPEVIELGQARNEILSQKERDTQVDNWGLEDRRDHLDIDDFDE